MLEKSIPSQHQQESDEFNDSKIGLQWQWHANPKIKLGFLLSAQRRYPFQQCFKTGYCKKFMGYSQYTDAKISCRRNLLLPQNFYSHQKPMAKNLV